MIVTMFPRAVGLVVFLAVTSMAQSQDIFRQQEEFWKAADNKSQKIDREFEEAFRTFPWLEPSELNESIEGDTYILTMKLPGVTKTDIKVKRRRNLIFIRAIHAQPDNPASNISYRRIQKLPEGYWTSRRWNFSKDNVFKLKMIKRSSRQRNPGQGLLITTSQRPATVKPKGQFGKSTGESETPRPPFQQPSKKMYPSDLIDTQGNTTIPQTSYVSDSHKRTSGIELMEDHNSRRIWNASQSNSQSQFYIDQHGNLTPLASGEDASTVIDGLRVKVRSRHFDYQSVSSSLGGFNGDNNATQPYKTGSAHLTETLTNGTSFVA